MDKKIYYMWGGGVSDEATYWFKKELLKNDIRFFHSGKGNIILVLKKDADKYFKGQDYTDFMDEVYGYLTVDAIIKK